MPKDIRNRQLTQLKRSGVIPFGSKLLSYDGRKNLNPHQKRAITKLYNKYKEMGLGLDFVHVRRKPHESNWAYENRVKRIKKNSGQYHPFAGVAVESKFMEFNQNIISFENDRLNITGRDHTGAIFYESRAIDFERFASEGFMYLKEFTNDLEDIEYTALKPLNAMGYTTFHSGNKEDRIDKGRRDIDRLITEIVKASNAYRTDSDPDTEEGVKAMNSYNHWFTGLQLKRIELND